MKRRICAWTLTAALLLAVLPAPAQAAEKSFSKVRTYEDRFSDVTPSDWYYEDVKAVLSAIRPDPESAGQKKLLVFDVTGSGVQAGQSLNLSVGQRSSEYELVVPNSAIREDSNGKFILIVESRSGPISNRYIATRVDVEVLASDDNNTAISAGLYGYEYVITTSTKPVEAGKQVRLNES